MYRLGKWKYVNHLGETFESDRTRVFIEDNQILDFKRSYESKRGRVTKWGSDVSEKTIPIVLFGDDDKDGIELRNRLYDVTEKDVLDSSPGRFYLGDWYLSGYITESQKTNFMITDRLMQVSLVFVSEQGTWRKDVSLSLAAEKEESKSHVYRDPTITGHDASKPVELKTGMYPDFKYDYFLPDTKHAIFPIHDYPFDYFRKTGTASLVMTDAIKPSHFTMTIYGPCTHPVVIIGGHHYGVNAIVYEGERVVIDSEAKTVTKIGRLGEVTNLFNARDKEQSVFQAIPAGSSILLWPGTYAIDLVVHEQRKEPVWSLS